MSFFESSQTILEKLISFVKRLVKRKGLSFILFHSHYLCKANRECAKKNSIEYAKGTNNGIKTMQKKNSFNSLLTQQITACITKKR